MLAAPFAVRLALIYEAQGAGAADLRGFASDAGSAALVLALLIPLARLPRWAGLAVVLLWSLAQYANYETVTALGSIASVLDAYFLADPTFLRGSALAFAHPLLLAGVVCVPLGLAVWGHAVVGERLLFGEEEQRRVQGVAIGIDAVVKAGVGVQRRGRATVGRDDDDRARLFALLLEGAQQGGQQIAAGSAAHAGEGQGCRAIAGQPGLQPGSGWSRVAHEGA